jgi:hypothetical protein
LQYGQPVQRFLFLSHGPRAGREDDWQLAADSNVAQRAVLNVGPLVVTEFIPDHERIVLIENTAEIQIQKENMLQFETRREQNGIPAAEKEAESNNGKQRRHLSRDRSGRTETNSPAFDKL